MANEFIARKGLVSSGSVNVSGSVTASFFKGDGSQLTNLPAAAVLSSSVSIDTYTFNGDGSTKNYILSQSYDVSSLFVSVEGLSQTNIQDYTLTGATLSFISAPPASSNILVKALLNVTQNMTGSFSGSFFGILASASYATTASYAANAGGLAGVISSSTQFKTLTDPFTGSFTGSHTGTFPYSGLTGTPTLVSASSQIDYNSIQNKLSGVVSSSAQVQPLLPGGTVSSSAQYPGWVTASSQIDVRNTTGIATIATTGSNTFNGTQIVTGSLFTSGSNNLVGSTTLSGSLIVSGAAVTSTPNIRIYGDTEFTGYAKFNPVTSNIDTSISASYIYVSGSTKDLYFSQNSAGYSNVTRLRWLESNLYTGLLKGGILTTTTGSTTFNISAGEGVVVALNASTTQDPYPTIKLVRWDAKTNVPITYSGSAKITYVGLDNVGGVVQQTVPWGSTDINQFDTQINLGVVLHSSGSVSTGAYNAPQISYGAPQKADDFFRSFGSLKISGHTLQASGSSPTLSIKKTAGTSYREGSNYEVDPNHPNTVTEASDITISKIYRYYISGSTPVIDTGASGSGYTTIDNQKRVDTATGLLTSIGLSNWSIQRVFWVPRSPTNAFIVYYGNASYSTLLNAVNAINTEPFTEAPDTVANAIFLGYIIIEGGINRDLLNSSHAAIIQGGLFRNIAGVGSGGTQPVATTLAGLSDVGISSPAIGDLLVYNGATWNNTKSLNGSYSLTGSLATNDGITAITINATAVSASLSGSGAGVFGVNYNTLSNIPTGIVSSSTQVKPLLPGGIVSSSAQYPGWVTASSQIDYNSITNKLSGVISSSAQFNALTGTSASFAATASYVNTLLQTVSASGNIEAGVNLVSNFSSGDEGGQLELARSQTNTSISGSVVIDVFQNRVRIFEKNSPNRGGYWDVTGLAAGVGTNLAGGGGTVTSITAGSGLTGGTITGTGTITIDTGSTHFSSGVVKVLPAGTVSSSTQQVVSTYTNATDNYVLTSTGTGGINGESALLFDGAVLSVTTNNAKYFQGGDDAALYDVNVANTIGIYGVQDSTVGAIKLGSGGKTIYSNATGIGIGTTSPGAFLHVQGNVSASSFTGSLAYSSLVGVPGGLVSSSAQYPGWVTSSAQINTGSFTGSFTGSAKFNAAPIILVVDNHAFVGNGVTTNYTLSSSYDPAVLTVSVEGLLQTQTTDYTLSGTTLSFVATPPTSSNIFVKAFRLALV